MANSRREPTAHAPISQAVEVTRLSGLRGPGVPSGSNHGTDDVSHFERRGPPQSLARLGRGADAAAQVGGSKQGPILVDVVARPKADGGEGLLDEGRQGIRLARADHVVRRL